MSGGNPYHDKRGEFTDASGNVSHGPTSSPTTTTGAGRGFGKRLERPGVTVKDVRQAGRNVQHRRAVERQLQKPFTKGVQHGLKQRLVMERNGGVHPSKARASYAADTAGARANAIRQAYGK